MFQLEAHHTEMHAAFTETMGEMHGYMLAMKSNGRVLSALRATQLEQNKKLDRHSFALARLAEGQMRLENDVSGLKQDVSELKHDVSGLKQDVSELKHDVSGLKHDVSRLKQDVSELKQGQARLEDLVRRGFGMDSGE